MSNSRKRVWSKFPYGFYDINISYAKMWYGGNRPRSRVFIHANGKDLVCLRTGARLKQYLETTELDTQTSNWYRFIPIW